MPNLVLEQNNSIGVFSMIQNRHWMAAEKIRFVEEGIQPRMSVPFIARKHGVTPNRLFRWEKTLLYSTIVIKI